MNGFNIPAFTGIFINFLIGIFCQETSEICNGELFEATCQPGEVIMIQSALYGRMHLGRCVTRDYGFIGCSNDAIAKVDAACSGKASCRLTISNQLRMDAPGACESGLAGYAVIQYTCVQVISIYEQFCHGTEIQLAESSNLIASTSLLDACAIGNKLETSFTLQTNPGQQLNVSLWNFNLDADLSRSYGTIKDGLSKNMQYLTIGTTRFRNVLTTVGNSAELSISYNSFSENVFLLDVQVIGCKEISPVEGTWMEQHGDTLELGCNSGSKTWTLSCIKNDWVGVLGQCGTEQGAPTGGHLRQSNNHWNLSFNVFVLSICSMIFLLAACTFLVGVFVWKRKWSRQNRSPQLTHHTSMPLMAGPTHLDFSTLQRLANGTNPEAQPARMVWACGNGYGNTLPLYRTQPEVHVDPGEYKSLKRFYSRDGEGHISNGRDRVQRQNSGSEYGQYINSTKSDKSESVKYYILEDLSKGPGGAPQ